MHLSWISLMETFGKRFYINRQWLNFKWKNINNSCFSNISYHVCFPVSIARAVWICMIKTWHQIAYMIYEISSWNIIAFFSKIDTLITYKLLTILLLDTKLTLISWHKIEIAVYLWTTIFQYPSSFIDHFSHGKNQSPSFF